MYASETERDESVKPTELQGKKNKNIYQGPQLLSEKGRKIRIKSKASKKK